MNKEIDERTQIIQELAPLLNQQKDEDLKALLTFLKSGKIKDLVNLKIYRYGPVLDVDIWVMNKGELHKVKLNRTLKIFDLKEVGR